MARARRYMSGTMVVFKHLPPSVLRDHEDEKHEIVEASVRPFFLLGYRQDDGRAELEFEDFKGILHAIRVDPALIEPADAATRREQRKARRQAKAQAASARKRQ